MGIRVLQAADKVHYSALWSNALIEQDEFFRISINDEPLPQIQTEFTNDSFTLGAFLNASLVGTVSVARDSRTKLKHKALLFRMFVHQAASGTGIGKALLKEAISKAKGIEGLRQIYLTVLATNVRAINLYTAMGFETFAREPGSVKISTGYVDELQMALYFACGNSCLPIDPNMGKIAI